MRAWLHREEVALLPYGAGALVALLSYADTALTTAHPSGQADVLLAMAGSLAVKAAIVALRRRYPQR